MIMEVLETIALVAGFLAIGALIAIGVNAGVNRMLTGETRNARELRPLAEALSKAEADGFFPPRGDK